LQSVLDNSLETTSSTTFTVSVININEQIEYSAYYVKPEFHLLLENQVVTVGRSLLYPITFIVKNEVTEAESEPFTMQITIEMAKIKAFATFDYSKNTLEIDGDKLRDADAGFYTVDVSATF
jgi:hypothetical protein